MKFEIPSAPIYDKLVSLLPEEGEYHASRRIYEIEHRTYSLLDWLNRKTFHEGIAMCEEVIYTCIDMTSHLELSPVLRYQDDFAQHKQSYPMILDTGTVLWIPTQFTTQSASSAWMYGLSEYVQTTLLMSRWNRNQVKTVREMLGATPLVYTLERMMFNQPYSVVL